VDHPPLEHAWLLDNSPISDLPEVKQGIDQQTKPEVTPSGSLVPEL